MFMVGSFAGGLSEGLTAGWALGKDIQDRIPLIEARDKAKADLAKQKADSALPSVAAKAPSVNDPDVPAGMSTGITNLTADGATETFDPNHPDATRPAKIENGKVPTAPAQPAALLPPSQRPTTMPDGSASSTVPAPVPPAAGPVAATAAIPPPVRPEEMTTEYPPRPPPASAGDVIWNSAKGIHRAVGGEYPPYSARQFRQDLGGGVRQSLQPSRFGATYPVGNAAGFGQAVGQAVGQAGRSIYQALPGIDMAPPPPQQPGSALVGGALSSPVYDPTTGLYYTPGTK